MASDLRAIEDWAEALLQKFSASERRKLTQSIARDLRRSQQQRIAAQKNPDGTPYTPRKPQQDLRSKKGRIKKMFGKIRQAKHLKLQSTPGSIAIGFVGRTARIARVHQYGLRDRARRDAPDIQYAQRELLGLTDDDLGLIRDKLLEYLAD